MTRVRKPWRIASEADPKTFAHRLVDPLPCPVRTPSPEVVIDGATPGEVVRKQTSLASALQQVKDGVDDFAKIVGPGPSEPFEGGKVGLYVFRFGVGKIRGVSLSHAC